MFILGWDFRQLVVIPNRQAPEKSLFGKAPVAFHVNFPKSVEMYFFGFPGRVSRSKFPKLQKITFGFPGRVSRSTLPEMQKTI